MKLLYVIAGILAICLAETETELKEIEDSEAAASVELLKEGADLKPEASAYNYVNPSQRPPQWAAPGYVPTVPTWNPPQQPLNDYNPPKEPVKDWNAPQNPINTWQPPQNPINTWGEFQQKPVNSWIPPQNPPKEPVGSWKPPQNPVNTWVPPVQSDYIPNTHPPTATTPVPVIKNEQYYYDNGGYKYEYQIGDGTHVGEEGYFTNPKQDEESIVKKGWYSFVGADGKTYTVTYWADKTGFHAYGDHLPTPHPVPAAIQAALDKEKENELTKPQQDYYTTQAPQQVYYPTQAPAYVPPKQPAYIPPKPSTYYPQQPTYIPAQPTYPTNV